MSEWQPIETAPENQWILVYEPGLAVMGDYMIYPTLKGYDGVWYEYEGMAMLDFAQKSTMFGTHWMLLPEPPEAA